MAGVGEPHLIVCGASSPHTFSMRPSDAAALEGADVIFLIDERKETALAGPIAVSGWRRRPMGGRCRIGRGPNRTRARLAARRDGQPGAAGQAAEVDTGGRAVALNPVLRAGTCWPIDEESVAV